MQPEIAPPQSRIRFLRRFGSVAVASVLASLTLPACGVGNVIYALEAQSASSKLEEARQAGAEKTALYEYTLAQEHLSKAMSEASEASYGDAYELAQLADQFAEQATLRARIRMRAVSSEPTHESASSAAQSIPPANEAQK